MGVRITKECANTSNQSNTHMKNCKVKGHTRNGKKVKGHNREMSMDGEDTSKYSGKKKKSMLTKFIDKHSKYKDLEF